MRHSRRHEANVFSEDINAGCKPKGVDGAQQLVGPITPSLDHRDPEIGTSKGDHECGKAATGPKIRDRRRSVGQDGYELISMSHGIDQGLLADTAMRAIRRENRQ